MSNTIVYTYAKTYNTAEDAVNDANSFLDMKLQILKYYKMTANKKDKNKTVININSLLATVGTSAFFNKPVFVYGSNIDASKESTTNGRVQDENNEYRSLGYARDGSIFANPKFTADNEGYKATDKRWVAEPWRTNRNKDLYGEDGKMYKNKYISSGIYDYIKTWVNTNRFIPNDLQRSLDEPNLTDSEKRKYFAVNALNPPPVKNFENCMYIIQPPTEHVWGLGIAFYYWTNSNGVEHLNYRTFRLQPFDMEDISAQFYRSPNRKERVGDEVLIGIKMKSTFQQPLNDIPFKLEITKDAGIQLNEKADSLEILGNLNIKDNILNIPSKGENLFYVKFKMPNSYVKLSFSINKDGNNPEEGILENNNISLEIDPIIPIPETMSYMDIPYNVLSKDVSFILADGKNIEAKLEAPNNGNLFGNAGGQLNVINNSPLLFNPFYVSGNTVTESVSEHTATITKNPKISTTIHRRDATKVNGNTVYDDPENSKWLNGSPGPETKTVIDGKISFNTGEASSQYKYYCSGCVENGDGSYSCPNGHISNTSAKFNGSSETKKITTYIYNGKRNITKKEYKDQIDSNNDTSWTKNLFWTSEPYDFNVIRYMYHQYEDNSLSAPVEVNGQYQRSFINQNSAVSSWKISSSMKGNYKKSSKDNAVLATDVKYSGINFPINSGYYFNPAGTYIFTITTVTHKPTNVSTKDHADLVQAFIDAFRYESTLVYKDSNNNPVSLTNKPAVKHRDGYRVSEPVVIKVNDSIGKKWITVNKNYKLTETEEIKHSKKMEGFTDPRWKNILEGYSESGTPGSFNNFKYREYIKEDNKKMYKITEESTVTINLHPTIKNLKAYTHDRMANGDYYVKVWIDDIKLANHGYSVLPKLQGISQLDRIDIKVVGSKSDDINFGER
jgi:hypothetical protein